MSQGTDYFSDLLHPGEQILATIGGPGPTVERRTGTEQVWFQLAWTPKRLLVVRLVGRGSRFSPANRFAVARAQLSVCRYPRTPSAPARIELHGGAERIEVIGIDDPSIFPYVEPFLAAWGGPVTGGGQLHVAEVDPYAVDPQADTKKLLMVAGAGFLLIASCCGCGSVVFVVRDVLMPMFGIAL